MNNRWPIVGNEHIVEYLSRCLSKNKIEQTYIFEGPQDLGKNTVLKYFIQCLLCSKNEEDKTSPCGECLTCTSFIDGHPDNKDEKRQGFAISDLYTLERLPAKKNLSVSQVRDFIKRLSLSSFMGRYKIGIIRDAETLSVGAANALLKILEEPKKDVIIFLVTKNSKFLLPTIVSRSQILRFRAVSTDLIYDYLYKIHGAKRSQAKYLSHLSSGRPALALKFYKDKEFLHSYEEQSSIFFDFFSSDINNRLNVVKKIIEPKLRGQEASLILDKILDIYEGIGRDLILSLSGSQGRFKYIEREKDLSAIARKLGKDSLKNFSMQLEKARKYLQANVKPQNILDFLAISI